ncbi:hypothetical protein RclHR1_00420002 [Rhizophagus clarus]|uniref:Kinase-like domain-containing protein n=1 Tax=Rhizophagus clarus TaxID=94130 RepID=A0A2Z6RWX6_9GLOM|nr:hypothetical protein RclHR1_00420002 [Rhizophagus clarus]GES91166.1 kinase-like domain-containing protein [Rhizophagus clarus]
MSQQNQYQLEPDSEDVIQVAEFLSFIDRIESILKEISDISKNAKYNIEICETLKKRVFDANLTTAIDFKNKDQEFFNKQNYYYLQNLVLVIRKIKNFIVDVSQVRTLPQSKSIEKTLCREFENCLISLNLLNMIKIIKPLDDEKKHDKEKQLKAAKKSFEEFDDDMNKLQDGILAMVLQIDKLNEKTNIASNEPTQLLKFSDFNETSRKCGRVAKWVDVKNKCREFAFKDISEIIGSVQKQVTILKKLHDCQNIIKFYGITYDGNKWYSVTEWAEYGNLREFYTNHKHLFDTRLKLRISLDIARGLNFLNRLGIVHRDIRAENILVTINETAKLVNFQLCRILRAATFTSREFNRIKSLERVRYCAPELLLETPYLEYDDKCEVYSFGILLWEIIEEKIPYKDCRNTVMIANLMYEEYREPFSENNAIPEKFKNLSLDAVSPNPKSRPEITKMFEILCDCFESFEKSSRTPTH